MSENYFIENPIYIDKERDAKNFFKKAITIDDKIPEVHNNLGMVYINLNDAQTLLKYNNLISGYILSLKKIDNTKKIGNLLNEKLNYPLTSSTWIERHSNLFEWLSLQKYPITIVFAMIALVGILNISSSLTMIVMEKTKSIGC